MNRSYFSLYPSAFSLGKFAPLVLAVLLLAALVARAENTNNLTDAEIQGRQLARQLCEQPAQSFTNTGTLKVRAKGSGWVEARIKCALNTDSPTHWQIVYYCDSPTNTNPANASILAISHSGQQPNEYFWREPGAAQPVKLTGAETMKPFAGTDFWLADLGLEFFHWPDQKILPKTTALVRSRAYTLLESTNPHPAAGGYSRVRTWIDAETSGILKAEAYDAQGSKLKYFEPKSFKKVNGQYELQEMEIDNLQTGSITRLEFDLKK